MAYPTDRKYTKEHEWIQSTGTTAAIGISAYAQESLGDIVFVDLPKVGAELSAGKTFGTVESVKAVSDLYAPAWMVKITLKNPSELGALLSAADYDNFVAEESGH